MDFLEKDLEDIIWESSNEQLEEAGLKFSGRRFRQFRIGNYGISDLITASKKTMISPINNRVIDNILTITIYELKNRKVGISAFLQAINYARGIKSYLEQASLIKFEIKIILIGREIDRSGSFIYLTDLIRAFHPDTEDTYNYGVITSIDFYEYQYQLTGIKFKKVNNYKLINEGL